MATRTYDRRTTTTPRRTDSELRSDTGTVRRRRWTAAIPRSRGFLSGVVLVGLGIWGALIPLVGPYFGYEFGSDQTWNMTWNRLWLDVLPGAALVLGGLMLMWTRNRASGIFGGWLALCGGAWFVMGPTVAMLWDSSLGAGNPIGAPIGSDLVQVLELLGYFYALGALAIAMSGMALGRLSVVGVRDVEAVEAAEPVERHERVEPAADDGAAGDGAPPKRRRLFRR